MAETNPTPCPRCAAPTVQIALHVGADPLVLRSCSRCDLRMWLRGDRPARFEQVLESVAATGRRQSA